MYESIYFCSSIWYSYFLNTIQFSFSFYRRAFKQFSNTCFVTDQNCTYLSHFLFIPYQQYYMDVQNQFRHDQEESWKFNLITGTTNTPVFFLSYTCTVNSADNICNKHPGWCPALVPCYKKDRLCFHRWSASTFTFVLHSRQLKTPYCRQFVFHSTYKRLLLFFYLSPISFTSPWIKNTERAASSCQSKTLWALRWTWKIMRFPFSKNIAEGDDPSRKCGRRVGSVCVPAREIMT